MKVKTCNVCERLEVISSGCSKIWQIDQVRTGKEFLAISIISVYRNHELLVMYTKIS